MRYDRHSTPEQNKRLTGSHYEEIAARYLSERGYRIIEAGYRTRAGEIDLIALDDQGTLVFIEVKYRRGSDPKAALEAVNARKQRQIIRMAQIYLMKHSHLSEMPMRFDVIGICDEGGPLHVENAFDAGM